MESPLKNSPVDVLFWAWACLLKLPWRTRLGSPRSEDPHPLVCAPHMHTLQPPPLFTPLCLPLDQGPQTTCLSPLRPQCWAVTSGSSIRLSAVNEWTMNSRGGGSLRKPEFPQTGHSQHPDHRPPPAPQPQLSDPLPSRSLCFQCPYIRSSGS